MNKSEPIPQEVLFASCLIGIGLMKAESIELHIVAFALCCFGAKSKLLTVPGAIVFVAGIAGYFYLDSFKAPMAAAAVLAMWFISTYVVSRSTS